MRPKLRLDIPARPAGSAFARSHHAGGMPEIRAAADGAAEMLIYDEIGAWFDRAGNQHGITAQDIASRLAALNASHLRLRINSPGGDVFDGLAIYQALLDWPGTVESRIEGLAASAASLVAIAGDTVKIAQGGFVMIHNAWALAIGNEAAMRQMADTLGKIDGALAAIYSARTGASRDQARQWMDAETWFDAETAIANGFADGKLGDPTVENRFDLSGFAHVPAEVRARFGGGAEDPAIEAAATPFRDLPLAARDRPFDNRGAETRVRDWAGAQNGPNRKYRDAFFWAASGNDKDGDGVPDNFGDYKLIFADVIGGRLIAVPRGIFAAAGVMQGARGGVQIPDADRAGVKNHISRYYAKMRKEFGDSSLVPPWENASAAHLAEIADAVDAPDIDSETRARFAAAFDLD